MVKKEFRCRRCGHEFRVEVFEKGEAQAVQAPARPVCCLKCGGPVERIS